MVRAASGEQGFRNQPTTEGWSFKPGLHSEPHVLGRVVYEALIEDDEVAVSASVRRNKAPGRHAIGAAGFTNSLTLVEDLPT